ncbi:MAG TPA: hypothetical protein VFB33_10655 [Candidatus Binataceae bacterium]|nr:hypothetical protein [Candidatus Binataceae bacterium]
MSEASNEMFGAASAPAPRPLSLLRCSPAFFAFLVVAADAGRWADPDLWGHIAFGRLFLHLGRLPPRDIYSYSAFGHPWHDHEWLSEVILALAYDAGGVLGLKLLKLACTATTMTLLAIAAAETGAAIGLQQLVLATAAVGLGPMMQFRPQLFDFIGLSALLLILARQSYRRSGPLWPAVPLLGLWANLHGGFFIGLAALAVYTAATAVEDWFSGDGYRRAGRLSIAFAVCLLATLVNPYGIMNWATVFHTLHHPITRAIVSEWQPLTFRIAEDWRKSPLTAINFALALAPLIALAGCFVARPRGGDLPLVAVAALMGAGAWVAVRNLALAVIASTVPLCRHAELVGERRGWRRAAAGERTDPLPHAANQWLIGAIAAGLAAWTGLFSHALRPGFAVPQGAVAFMRAHRLKGNVLCDFAWGEYVIFHLAPAAKVFIDARYDMVYPRRVIEDYLNFFLDRSHGAQVLAGYPHDFVLIRPDAPARALIERGAGWELIYSDSAAMLFARAGARAAQIDGVPIRGKSRPAFFP